MAREIYERPASPFVANFVGRSNQLKATACASDVVETEIGALRFNMGGTSTDVSLIRNGEPLLTSKGNIEGWPVVLPMLDLVTVGAGGGSVAWLDIANGLKVGPKSARSVPGPAYYGDVSERDPALIEADLRAGLVSRQAAVEEYHYGN